MNKRNIEANSSVNDIKTNTQPELGFSIKSQLGSPASLLNASKATNFIYELSSRLSERQITDFNETKSFHSKFEKLKQFGCTLRFKETESRIFGNNLILIDSKMPEIAAYLTLLFFSSKKSSVSELTEKLREINPIGYDLQYDHNFYEYKIKHFLTDVALGLMPNKVWKGQYDTTGGYLIVKETGDILAYHIYNKNQFENYLFKNTKLETASTNRHDYGKIYEKDGEQLLKLNLQIRFKK